MTESVSTEENANLGSAAPQANLIPGLSLIDDSKLHADFRKVKGNPMYFVDRCTFYKKQNSRGEDYMIVLSPGAIFLLDFNGVMERATVYSRIMDMYQKKSKKGIMGFASAEHHLVLKVPEEVDYHVSFSSSSTYQHFILILRKILEAQRGKLVLVKDVPENKDITFFFSDKPAEGYYTPREIAEITRQRAILDLYIRVGLRDVSELLTNVARGQSQVAGREAEVEALRQKGIDEESIRRRKTEVEDVQLQLQEKVAEKHEECERVLTVIKKLQAEITKSRNDVEALVEKGVAEALEESVKKHNETVELRRRAQQKEKNALEEEIAALRRDVAAPLPQQSAKAKAQDAAVAAELAELERDLETCFRLEKFLATVNGEIETQGDIISALNEEKQKWIQEREKSTAAKAPVEVADPLGTDPLMTPTGNDDADDMLL